MKFHNVEARKKLSVVDDIKILIKRENTSSALSICIYMHT